MSDDIQKAMLAALQPCIREIKALKAQVAELQSRPEVKYVGTFSSARQYGPGEFCTHDGSLWHCNQQTREQPGHSGAWTLAAKRGKDAKGAR